MTTLQQKSLPENTTPQEKLALHGGPKAVTAPGRDRWKHVRLRDVIPVAKQLRWGIITSADGGGPIHAFESEFAKLCGCQFGLAMNSGTAALHSALFAVGVGPGDEVILPSYTYHATASAVLCCGAKPVFADIDPRTLTLDPADLESRITDRTKAILVVHVWGNPAEMDAIRQVADRHQLAIVEDCSHAHGAAYQGKPVGSWGEVGCFSLQGAKAVSAGEGGIAVCNDARYFDRMLALGHPVRVKGGCQQKEFDIGGINLGPKYRPHLFGVLLAHQGLKRLPKLNELRQRNWDMLCQELKGCPGVSPVETLPGARRGGFLEFKFSLQTTSLQADREGFIKALQAEGVPCSEDRYGTLHDIGVFRIGGPVTAALLTQTPPEPPPQLPQTESLPQRIFTLPAFADVPEGFVHQCGVAIRKVAHYFSRMGTTDKHPSRTLPV